MFKHLATISKRKGREFHFYTYTGGSDKLYCTVDDDKEPALDKNVMEYYPKEKWLVLANFGYRSGIKYKGKNVKIRKVRILGLKIENFIINKIFWNFKYNINDPEYTWDNYVNFKRLIQHKRGFLVKVCMSKTCGTAILVSTTKGTKLDKYKLFLTVKRALDKKPRHPWPLIYHLTDKFYFIEMRSESAKKFLCYRCLTGQYYMNSSSYDLMRYGWESKQGLENYTQEDE